MGVKFEMSDRVRKVKGKPLNLKQMCVDHCILLLKHLSNHMHFITNGYKRFSKTNSTDPWQRVPLKGSVSADDD